MEKFVLIEISRSVTDDLEERGSIGSISYFMLLSSQIKQVRRSIQISSIQISASSGSTTLIEPVGLSNNQTITGEKTFSTLPKSSVTPTDNDHLTNKAYVDSAISTVSSQTTTNTEDISGLKGEVVYNNTSGSDSDIVIDDITGAAYIDIVYSILFQNEYTYYSKRIYDPIGKKISLDGMIFLTSQYSNNFAVAYQISATAISHTGTYGYFNRKYPDGTMNGETNNYDVLKINKVVAYY